MSCEGTSTGNETIQTSDGGKENAGDLAVEPSKEEKELTAENGGSAEAGATENGAGLSKSALKRLKSRERWLEHRKRKRIEEKQRKKEKRAALREAGLGTALKRFRGKTMDQSSCKIRVVVDVSFDHLMSEKDCRRTVQQLNWCYSANRRLPEPMQLYITSFQGTCRKIYDSIESNRNHDIFLKTEHISELFKPSEIVYLTAESDNVLSELEESKVYVIGGLVDHNSHKGLCYEQAVKNGYGHARLPIDEFVEMKTRKVLTINHVFEILAHFSAHGDWEKAFFSVMPARKGMLKKTCAEGDDGLSDEGGSQSASENGADEADEGEETGCPSTKRVHKDGDGSSTENQ